MACGFSRLLCCSLAVNIFSSSFFTALSNGKISALLSFTKNLAFVIVGILSSAADLPD